MYLSLSSGSGSIQPGGKTDNHVSGFLVQQVKSQAELVKPNINNISKKLTNLPVVQKSSCDNEQNKLQQTAPVEKNEKKI